MTPAIDDSPGHIQDRTAPIKDRSAILSMSVFRKAFLEVSLLSSFAVRFVREAVKPPYEFEEVMKQSYSIGYKSLFLVCVTAFIMGVVLTIQARPTMEKIGAESWLPAMVAVSIIREIGPVITGLLCAGRVGSGIGAELATMKVTEQIDAMKVSGINPFKFVVVTRVLAATLTIPLLVIVADASSLYGAYIANNLKGTVSYQLFFLQVFQTLTFVDVLPAFIKTFVFGFAIGIIGCFQGYNAEEGTQGVGKAANSAVVMASLVIFVIDVAAVQIAGFLE